MIPFFTVIVCTYNRARYLHRALGSILDQSCCDWEVIVVDDGSTDSTLDLLGRYRDQRFKVVRHKRNLGVGAARNTGIKHSTGQFVTFLDSDDEYLPNHLDNRKKVLKQMPSVQLLHGGVEVIGDPFVVDKDDYGKRIHLDECAIGGTFFIRRDVFDAVGLFRNLRYADDSDFFERAVSLGIEIHKTGIPSYRYFRNTQNQVTSKVGEDTKGALANVMRSLRQWMSLQLGLLGEKMPIRG